jgi:hypothetical protein
MFPLDESQKCTITENSFVEDLLDYTVSTGQILWSDQTQELYTSKINIFNNISKTFWFPNFILDDSLVDTKMISHYGSIVGDTDLSSGRIGIEQMFSFAPKFKNWTTTNSKMSIDWILNRPNIPYCVVGGLSHWSISSPATTGNIQNFPQYSRLKHNNIEYIKIDDETIRAISPNKVQQSVFNSRGTPVFRYTEQDDTKIKDLTVGSKQPIFTLVGSDSKKVWVADGDQILYFMNKSEKTKRLASGIGPQSYISGSLYKYYTNIYNALTADNPVEDVNASRPIKQLRLYQKLSHSLATSPFVSEFFIHFLSRPSDAIKDALRIYLNSNSNDINTDIANLTTILSIISQEYSKYEIQDQNILYNNDELFIKLINKYGAKLVLNNTATVTYRNSLAHGDSVIVEEIGNFFIPKNTNNVTIANNKRIGLSKLSVETNMGPIESSINLWTQGVISNNIQLYDTIKPNVKETSNFNIVLDTNNNIFLYTYKKDPANSRIPIIPEYDPTNNVFYFALGSVSNNRTGWLEGCPRLRAINLELDSKYTNSRFPLRDEDMINREFSCIWERVSGPNVQFVDLDKVNTEKTYSKAYGTEVIMVPSTTGRYVVKCTISGPFGSYTKIKTIFIVDGRERIASVGRFGQVFCCNENANFGSYIDTDSLPEGFLFTESVFSDISIPADDQIRRITPTPEILATLSYENIPIPLNRDRLNVFIAGADATAIHRNGLYVPIRSNFYVDKIVGNSRPIEKLQNNNYKFMFNPDGSINNPSVTSSTLSIRYNNNNTILKLDRIILRNLRNSSPECSQCYSLYDPKFRSYIGATNRPSFIRSNKSPDGFTLQKYAYDELSNSYRALEFVDYFYPIISTDLAPSIKTYGGYGNKILNNIAIKNIDSLEKPRFGSFNSGIVANDPKILPPVTGYNLDYKADFAGSTSRGNTPYKYCYEQIVAPNGHINFAKGTFIPGSGWLVGDNRNLSSVLKFNPGARSSYSFVGPGILGISNYTSTNSISASVFSSSINLSIKPAIQWDPGPSIAGERCLPDDDEQRRNALAEAKGIHAFNSQLAQELADHWISGPNKTYHHGYRTLGGNIKYPEKNITNISTPINDEFEFSSDEKSNTFSYAFTKVGYNNPMDQRDANTQEFINLYLGEGIKPGSEGKSAQVREYIENNNDLGIVVPRINSLTIKDIEVKLNFLNYVNTKNLVIWLEVNPSDSEKESMRKRCSQQNGCIIKSQIKADNTFIDQFIASNVYRKFPNEDEGTRFEFPLSETIDVNNNDYNEALKKLTDLNSNDKPEVLKLYLLNQETIQNKEYNFSVKFSDTADKNNVLFDHNLFGYGKINGQQNIVSNNNEVRPTTNIPGFDTRKNCFISNALKFNNLNINNNTFNKFAERSIFQGVHPEAKCVPVYGPFNSNTTFTLNIAVLEESDDMTPLDTLVSNEIYSNLGSVENKISSANLFNNLCSWELIVHTTDTKKPVTSLVNSLANYGGTDALGLIEYGSAPKYPGYNFIANLAQSKFLLPLVNMNAPSTFFQNYNACDYADNEIIGKGVIINGPRFPTEAILLILAGTAVGGMSGTLVGVLVGGLGPTYAAGFNLIYDYFRESRIVPLLENAQRETFDVDYDAYPMGSSDKILINASKDGLFWYKMEASIFKLSNTPALPLKQFKFLKGDDVLFKFPISPITKNSDFIDEIFVPLIASRARSFVNDVEDSEETRVADYNDIDNYVYDNINFMNITEFACFNKLVQHTNIFEARNAGSQLILIENTLPYYLINIDDTINLACFVEQTNSEGENNNNLQEEQNRGYKVTSKALVYKNGKYQCVLAVDGVSIGGCSDMMLPEDVIVAYDNATTTEGPQESPVSLYGLVNQQPPDSSIPNFTFSTNSLGSYGDGSIVKDKNILSRTIRLNKLAPVYDQLNNFINDKLYFNTLTLDRDTSDDEEPEEEVENEVMPERIFGNKLKIYPVYYDQNNNDILVNNNDFVVASDANGDIVRIYITEQDFNSNRYIEGQVRTENNESITLMDGRVFIIDNIHAITRETLQEQKIRILNTIQNNLKDHKSYQKDKKYNLLYIKAVNNDYVSDMQRISHGLLTIENIYTYNENIQSISQDNLSLLTNRLNRLNQNNVRSLELDVGKRNRTSAILASDSIYYISLHYESLDEDPSTCFEPSGSNNSACIKLRTFNKLKRLIYEKNEILKILDNQTIKKAAILYDRETNDDPETSPAYRNSVEGVIKFEDSKIIQLDSDARLFYKDEDIVISYQYELDPDKQIYRDGPGGIIADNRIDITSNTDGSLNINYINNTEDYYWINIDPKQGCSIAEEMRPKVLKSIKYECDSTNPVTSAVGVGAEILDFNNICPDWTEFTNLDSSNVDFDIEATSQGVTYKTKESVVDAKIKKLEDLGCNSGWIIKQIQRRYRIHSERNIKNILTNVEFLVTTTEEYEVAMTPLEAAQQAGRTASQLISQGIISDDNSGDPFGKLITETGSNNGPMRVYNIFNLDDVQNLKVQFRKVPRMIRGIDALFTVLRYGENSSYRPQRTSAGGPGGLTADGPLDPTDTFGVGRTDSLINDFYQWVCYETNPNNGQIRKAATPEIFQLFNEMMFRAFFGSVDGIEHKTEKMKSLYQFEMIPYEYFTKPNEE